MVEETWPSLEELELKVKNTTITYKKAELAIIENLLNQYLAGFRVLREFKAGEIQRLELAWLLLVVRGFNSLRCAYDLLQKGYYSQAVILIRATEEDYLTCRHCDINQETVEALLVGKSKVSKFGKMARDISPEFSKKWDVNYGQLSEIAHPRWLAMGMTASWKENKINLGANYIENHFIATCHALLRSAVGMIEFLVKLLGKDALQWQKESFPAFQEACTYVEKISKEMGSTMKQE
jgi:hypothetical protein